MGHEYPPADWTVDGVERALREHGDPPLPSADEPETWEGLRSNDRIGPVLDRIIREAGDLSGKPIPEIRASEYLEYSRSGDRSGYQAQLNEREKRLTYFAVAECAERNGEYLDDVLDYAWDVCEESTWILPAHLWNDELPRSLPGPEQHITLRQAATALELAEIDFLLGDRQNPALHDRIEKEIRRRIVRTYEERDDFWWLEPPTNNWSAVCHNGVVGAALYVLDDERRQAELIVDAADSLQHYLEGFGPDGATAEGVGYWNYGFGHYVQLAQHVHARTGGEYSLLSPPVCEAIATFPIRAELSPGRYPAFSDSREAKPLVPFAAFHLGAQFDAPALVDRGIDAFGGKPDSTLPNLLRDLLWLPEDPVTGGAEAQPSTYFSGTEWWLARATPSDPDGLCVAAKAGYNGESHNHNDAGSFVVHHRRESTLTDLGSPTYDAGFFGDERYEYLTARSLGHSVPYVDGYEQAPGDEYAATVLDVTDTGDTATFSADISDCYPVDTGLESLMRQFELDRGAERITVTDDVSFADGDNRDYESVLVSYAPIRVEGDTLRVEGDDSSVVVRLYDEPTVEVEHFPDAVDVSGHNRDLPDERDVWRARLDYGPVPVSDGADLTTVIEVVPSEE
jgi:hypothetical protein